MQNPSISSAIVNCVRCCKKRFLWMRRAKQFSRPRAAMQNASSHGFAGRRAYAGFPDSVMNPPCKPRQRIGFDPRVWAENHTLRQPAVQVVEQRSATLFPFPYPWLEWIVVPLQTRESSWGLSLGSGHARRKPALREEKVATWIRRT